MGKLTDLNADRHGLTMCRALRLGMIQDQTLGRSEFHRSRYDALRVLDDFVVTLRHRIDADEVVEGWVDVVGETMQPAVVGAWIRR